jgi:hypothetical protein
MDLFIEDPDSMKLGRKDFIKPSNFVHKWHTVVGRSINKLVVVVVVVDVVVVVVVVAGACSNKYQSVAADVCIFPTVQHTQSCFANRRYCPHFRS